MVRARLPWKIFPPLLSFSSPPSSCFSIRGKRLQKTSATVIPFFFSWFSTQEKAARSSSKTFLLLWVLLSSNSCCCSVMTKEQTSWFCCIKVGDTCSPWRLRLTGGKVKCYLNANHELLSPNIRNPFITEFVIHVTSREEKVRVDGNALLVLNIRKLRPGSYEKNSIPLKKSFPEKEKNMKFF